MRFDAPIAFFILLLIPLYLWLDRRLSRRAPAVRFPTVALLPKARGTARYAVLARRALRSLAFGLIAFGLAHPSIPQSGRTTTIEGIDICLALDISRSMRAEDFPPNRLEAAKETLRDFVKARRNDRIALVAFAGDAFLQCPLTLDHEALDRLIRAADFSLTNTEGTAIGDALVKSTARLKDSTAQSRIVVLLTDGESNRGEVDPESATEIAATLGIRVYTVGVGGERGAPIPIDDPVYGKIYVTNPDGTPLLTQLDEESLRVIADATGGRYFNAANRETLRAVLNEIDRLERSEIEVRKPPAFRDVAHWFFLAAIVALLFEAGLSRTWLRVLP
ncbi:MAG: VWA domain-containing protein [Candidatus Poribacteria bacterium]|nr:VWA domain-containing protein [Candidatus Poribacteria bacterium]